MPLPSTAARASRERVSWTKRSWSAAVHVARGALRRRLAGSDPRLGSGRNAARLARADRLVGVARAQDLAIVPDPFELGDDRRVEPHAVETTRVPGRRLNDPQLGATFRIERARQAVAARRPDDRTHARAVGELGPHLGAARDRRHREPAERELELGARAAHRGKDLEPGELLDRLRQHRDRDERRQVGQHEARAVRRDAGCSARHARRGEDVGDDLGRRAIGLGIGRVRQRGDDGDRGDEQTDGESRSEHGGNLRGGGWVASSLLLG